MDASRQEPRLGVDARSNGSAAGGQEAGKDAVHRCERAPRPRGCHRRRHEERPLRRGDDQLQLRHGPPEDGPHRPCGPRGRRGSHRHEGPGREFPSGPRHVRQGTGNTQAARSGSRGAKVGAAQPRYRRGRSRHPGRRPASENIEGHVRALRRAGRQNAGAVHRPFRPALLPGVRPLRRRLFQGPAGIRHATHPDLRRRLQTVPAGPRTLPGAARCCPAGALHMRPVHGGMPLRSARGGAAQKSAGDSLVRAWRAGPYPWRITSTSPSLTMYSLPSSRSRPFSRAPA